MRLAILTMLCSWLGGVAPVGAQSESGAESTVEVGPDEAEARRHFERGHMAFEQGRFEEAAAAFERAYELSGHAELLYNVYVSHRDAGNDARALDALRGYLDAGAPGQDAQRLEERARVLERRIAEDSQGGSSVVPIVVLASGGALAVAGIITAIFAESARSDLEAGCDGSDHCPPELESTRDRGFALAVTTDVLFGVAAAVGVVGLVLLLTGGSGDEAPAVSAGCGPDGCSVLLKGQL